MEIVRCTNGVGVWEVMFDGGGSEVFDLRSDAEEFLREYKKEQASYKSLERGNHNCWDFADYYEFEEDGHRFHGWECGRCGTHLQSG
jgi:hypothetical protein